MVEKTVMCSVDAETRTKNFIKKRHARAERIFFAKTYRDGNTWVLQGEVGFKHAYFFTTVRAFEAQVNMSTGEVTSYEEARFLHLEEQREKKSA